MVHIKVLKELDVKSIEASRPLSLLVLLAGEDDLRVFDDFNRLVATSWSYDFGNAGNFEFLNGTRAATGSLLARLGVIELDYVARDLNLINDFLCC